jgi:hypothetical protein
MPKRNKSSKKDKAKQEGHKPKQEQNIEASWLQEAANEEEIGEELLGQIKSDLDALIHNNQHYSTINLHFVNCKLPPKHNLVFCQYEHDLLELLLKLDQVVGHRQVRKGIVLLVQEQLHALDVYKKLQFELHGNATLSNSQNASNDASSTKNSKKASNDASSTKNSKNASNDASSTKNSKKTSTKNSKRASRMASNAMMAAFVVALFYLLLIKNVH